MTASVPTGPPAYGDLQQLRQSALENLCLVGLAASWLWFVPAGFGIANQEPLDLRPVWPAITVMLTCSSVLLLKHMPAVPRSILLLTGVSCCFLLGYLGRPSLHWLYFQSIVVGMAGLVAGAGASLVAASLLSIAALLCVSVMGMPQGIGSLDWVPVLILFWISAITSWFASHSLYTALAWAMHSQEQAWRAADDARRRRGEVRKALDSLRVTYGLLERTTQELNAARLAAEEARHIKARFVANISHEFRTPLNIIVGFAETLCTSPDSYGHFTWPPALREDLVAIWRNSEHLLKMIDDVLDLAQIEAGRLPILPEPTDLCRLMRDTLASAEALFRDSCLELRISLPDWLPGLQIDQTRIRQVILNLINNAVRHTHEGYVEVGITVGDEEVTVYVRDTGEGIPEERLETIFQEFEQAKMEVRPPVRGVGLGLAISKHFVRLHGGHIWAESALGSGSTFYFTLPIRRLSNWTPQPGVTRTLSHGRQLDDTRSVVALCQDLVAVRMLERHLEGVHILVASTVPEAVALVHEHHPAAAVIARRPLEPIDQIRSNARDLLDAVAPFDVPIISCSLPTESHTSLNMKVAGFLLKPVTGREVVSAIRSVHDSPRSILLVEDDPDMLRLLRRLVQREWPDMAILLAASGEEAICQLAQMPDVILLDLGLPGKSGLDVLNAIQEGGETAQIPVVVVTARSPADGLAPIERGELYLAKNAPLTREEVVRLLDVLTKALPSRYVVSGIARLPSTPATPPA